MAWEFQQNGEKLHVRVDGQLAFNSSVPIMTVAVAGHGLAYIPEDLAELHILEGRLQRVLGPWCPAFGAFLPLRHFAVGVVVGKNAIGKPWNWNSLSLIGKS
jgi:DNA-binding transcriptional LysR family regulator